MKKIIVLLLIVSLVGCGYKNDKSIKGENNSDLAGLKVIVLDGCEYFQFKSYTYYSITHKGNCKNPIHNKL